MLVGVSKKHAAWTHLHEVETWQQADTVFGQGPLLPRRHGRASEYPNGERSEMETRERGGVGSELCGRQERSMPLRAARRSGGWPVSGPVSPLTRAALRVMTAPGLSARCARPPTSCQVETPSNTDRGREGGRRGRACAMGRNGFDSLLLLPLATGGSSRNKDNYFHTCMKSMTVEPAHVQRTLFLY